MIRQAIMKGLAPLSYWAAWFLLKWATHPHFGRVDGKHPAAAEVGQKIVHYENLLGIRGQRNRIRL